MNIHSSPGVWLHVISKSIALSVPSIESHWTDSSDLFEQVNTCAPWSMVKIAQSIFGFTYIKVNTFLLMKFHFRQYWTSVYFAHPKDLPTIITKEHCPLFPASSLAKHVTVVLPNAKLPPDPWVHITSPTSPSLSVAVTESHWTDMSDVMMVLGQVNTGGSRSVDETKCIDIVVFRLSHRRCISLNCHLTLQQPFY